MQSSACNINYSRNICNHSKCNRFIYICTTKRRLHNLHHSPYMQSTACILDESTNKRSHQKCNHFIYIHAIKKRLHNLPHPPQMQSNACISHDCKTVCRHPICNHPAYGGLLAYLHILTRSAVTRMCRHTIARNARCKHLTWHSYAMPPRWWDKSPQSPLKTVAYRLCSCITTTPPKAKPKCKIAYGYFSKSVLAE